VGVVFVRAGRFGLGEESMDSIVSSANQEAPGTSEDSSRGGRGRRGCVAGAKWLPPVREGGPAPQWLLDRRLEVEGQRLGEVAAGVVVRGVTYSGVRCLEIVPREVWSTTIYLHGGGYRMGSPEVYAPFASQLAGRCSTRVILPRYALAPEKPFPTALREVAAVYEATSVERGPLVIGGDSAGGGLALGVVLALNLDARDVAGVVLLSPWVDLTLSGASYQFRADLDHRFSMSAAQEAADAYLRGCPADNPLVSPLFGDLTGLPPLVVLVGTDEVLFDDSRRLVEKATQHGKSVELHVFSGMQHVWPIADPEAAESERALRIISRFYETVLGPSPPQSGVVT
jgi:epsilon-lactone hydrolase